MKKGFTLIELLVVVLIIGILSAVALPKYQVAVARTRYQQAVVLASALLQAQMVYKMANGTYALSFDELDISIPTPKSISGDATSGQKAVFDWGWCQFRSAYPGSVNCGINKASNLDFTPTFRECTAATNNDLANKVCKTETGLSTPTQTKGSYAYYRYP